MNKASGGFLKSGVPGVIRVDLIGYAPDEDPTMPGSITDCTNMVPTFKGFAGAPSPTSTGLAALAAKSLGAAVLRRIDNTTRFLAGTQTALYEAGATSWTNVSRAATYTGGTQSLWRFCQFGNVSIAANGADTMQSSSIAVGAFSCISSAPIAKVCETVNQFVFAANTNSFADQVAWSALGDQTQWTPSITTQAGSLRLTSTPGPITAARRLGDNLVVYKDRGMYVGVYAGPPNIWSFQEVSSEVGAPSQEAVVPITKPSGGMAHIFMGYENFYFYDGALPVPVPGYEQVVESFFADLNRQYANLTTAVHNRAKAQIYFYYVSIASTSGVIDKCLVYNYKTAKFGRDNRNIESAVEYIAAGTTYDSLGTLYSTYDSLPTLPYDSPFWTSNNPSPAIIDTTHTVKTLTGASVSSDFTTGDMGNENYNSLLSRVRIEYLSADPTTASMTNMYRLNGRGDSLTTDQTTSESNKKFDVLREARWHKLKFSFTGDVELDKMNVTLEPSNFE